jgi:MoaA/NifB/PqqE/SkfB family radical SAM enzyme
MFFLDPLPEDKVLSIMLTFQCTAECKNCGTLSSPREKTFLPWETAKKSIRQASKLGYKVVVFTGGETTLLKKDLLRGIRESKRLGLRTRIVTNGYWANNEKVTEDFINELRSSGLDEINFSTGDEHTRFVSIDNVIRGIVTSVKSGLVTAVMIELTRDRRITRKDIENNTEITKLLNEYPDTPFLIKESPWMPLNPYEIEKYPDEIRTNKDNISLRTGCDDIFRTTTIEADGSIFCCCGIGARLIPELQVGNTTKDSLKIAEERAKADFLKHWISIEGPERIIEWASNFDPKIKWENMYSHRCQACMRLYSDERIRKVISEHYKEKITDVLFNEWLLYHYRQPEPSLKN